MERVREGGMEREGGEREGEGERGRGRGRGRAHTHAHAHARKRERHTHRHTQTHTDTEERERENAHTRTRTQERDRTCIGDGMDGYQSVREQRREHANATESQGTHGCWIERTLSFSTCCGS